MNKRYLCLILVVAAGVRVGLLATAWGRPQALLKPDSAGYIRLSENLAQTGRFERAGRAEVFRTPGYPGFLLVGMGFGASWWRAAAVLQVGIDVLLVYLTSLLAWMLLGPRAGLWAGALQAICVVAVVSSLRILSDGLFALLVTLSVLLVVHHFKSGKWWSLVGSAAMLGAGCYVRPVGAVFAAVFVCVLLWRPKRFRRAGAFAGIVLGLLTPWVVRNAVRTGYLGFSSFAVESMYALSAPKTIAAAEDISESEARRRMRQAEADELVGRQFTVGGRIQYRKSEAMRIMIQHPGTFAAVHMRGTGAFFLPAATDVLEIASVTTGERGTLEVLQTDGVLAAARNYFGESALAAALAAPMVGILVVRYAGVVFCLIGRLRRRMSAASWLMLLMFVVAASAPGPANHPRFRAPVAPLVSVAAAAGWMGLAAALRQRRKKPAA